ncbi:hypothetical protein A8709_07085 [Paenibacillus pectinilyticus]|uniref:Uncharacterized protein n=1 Tax=Paenibacillus pectinilyticus TaxID=512399 RepID=A0A1C0ZTN8_9BACL|nr:hypothetical protein [Paenibacillus pectinilyticus]OCT11427.1 hypothetical protein A8709_07085 [Paenibacillus pectinilyticus]
MYFLKDTNTMAEITSEGICYKNTNYSCPLAISEQWFTLNSQYYLLKMPAIYSDEDDTLYIILDNGNLVSTFKLPNIILPPSVALNDYFSKLNQLKIEHKSAKAINKKKKG